jgi:putative DNA primase/helicase
MSSFQQSSPGELLLDKVKEFILRHVVVSDAAATVLVLWVVWTHISDVTYFQPRVAIISPEPRCGKSTLLRVLDLLCRESLSCSNITTAALFRAISSGRPTVLIDEADTFVSQREEISNILNAGFESTGTVIRCAPKTNQLETFKVGSPLAIAAIGSDTLKPSVLDRSIVVEMRRKAPHQKMQTLRVDKPVEANALAAEIGAWCALGKANMISAPEPKLPDLGSDRAADKYRPLFALAEFAGARWAQLASEAALELTAESLELGASTQSNNLLADIRKVFKDHGNSDLQSKNLLAGLLSIEEAPWGEAGPTGRPLTIHQLAKSLARFGIRPIVIHFGSGTNRGYKFDHFTQVFDTYLAKPRNSETE